MPLLKSWVESANSPQSPFPLNNLPYGIFSVGSDVPRCGVAIGDKVLDVSKLEASGVISPAEKTVFDKPCWNAFMDEGAKVWNGFRSTLQDMLGVNAGRDVQAALSEALVPMASAQLHMPFVVSEYTDFYSGRNHALNVGTMFRGAENALPPNWLHIPIGYNGRASSIVVSGTDIRRPWGQLKPHGVDVPVFEPCKRFDMELEIGAIVGTRSDRPVSVQEADDMIFGYVLLNDWSARDIQAWEYQPLGPFQAKATATTISPWIVTKAALEPFRADTPEREFPLLPYLKEPGPMLYDIELEVLLQVDGGNEASTIATTNYSEMYYSAAQQLAHHTSSGCPMRVGDLLGSGTISGPEKSSRGSLLELSWGGKEPFALESGEMRSFIEDNDIVTLCGHCRGDGFVIGFGDCTSKLLPALDDPYQR
ncbi:MAG: fumarylacetoacetase [Hyphomicrobiales bacterium]|nr:MAG: fumarylacetoacetase [Hyphomicrobiales bacterium]